MKHSPVIYPTILCGGSGTRLWPLSRYMHPKQFIDIGGGKSLFRETVIRAASLYAAGDIFVVCNNEHSFYVNKFLSECPLQGRIILEPVPRNTAPAIALAALAALDRAEGNSPLLLVMPSDHAIDDVNAFSEGVKRAACLAEQGYIATFGVIPAGPEPGFGYIKQGDPIGETGHLVARFIEKPDSTQANAMLAEGGYLWNSGMFLLDAGVYLEELKTYAPDIYARCSEAWSLRREEGVFICPDKDVFIRSPALSIDYAVMEYTRRAAVCPLDANWRDMGSWEAFYQAGNKDAHGNVCIGDILPENVENCYLHSTHRLIAASDIKDLVVVETQDALLIVPRNSAQNVKGIVEKLKSTRRREYRQHQLVHRPWGNYESLAVGAYFQIKRITVNPGAQLSLQKHYHRAEHWVVVSGTAEITNGKETQLYTENQSTYIPLGTVHRLKNPGRIPLVVIEIQFGAYLGEDDIVRLEDIYGRA